jgi:hypothetical protein
MRSCGKIWYRRTGHRWQYNRRMRILCWITKATNTHSECVILIASRRQQWLREGASMLRLYVHCLSCWFGLLGRYTAQISRQVPTTGKDQLTTRRPPIWAFIPGYKFTKYRTYKCTPCVLLLVEIFLWHTCPIFCWNHLATLLEGNRQVPPIS